MSEFVFIGQDGTNFVFVAEYLNVVDAREAIATLKKEFVDCNGKYFVHVRHFQAEPFVEYA